ncbi:MAG TPA: rhodanese-like domain-containing protein [Anaerolineae bacterium]|nr:rhodanese-like domain-containing protein [Anaerolineae bacterium]
MTKQASRRRGQPRRRRSGSLWIPAAVALVVVAIVVGLVLSVEGRGADAALQANETAQPLATNPLPYPEVPRISVAETWEGMQAGQVLLVDVRGQESYNSLHATDAVSIPEGEVNARLEELPRDRDIVLYCT